MIPLPSQETAQIGGFGGESKGKAQERWVENPPYGRMRHFLRAKLRVTLAERRACTKGSLKKKA